MADQKITELTELTTPVGADLLAIVDDPAGTPVTKKITLANTGLIDGWIPASESWSYASATTITVPSGAGSKYQKGDKIKLTQTTVKYFYIVGVADTVLTVTGGTDYTVADAAITANFYSKAENPQGFPDWFTVATNQIMNIKGQMMTQQGHTANWDAASPITVNYLPAFAVEPFVYLHNLSYWDGTNIFLVSLTASSASSFTLGRKYQALTGGAWATGGYGGTKWTAIGKI